MIDRKTPLHVPVVVSVFVVYVAIGRIVEIPIWSPAGAVLGAVFNIALFGGVSHAVLAARGRPGDLSVRARWRYVLALIAFFGAPVVVVSLFERGTAAWIGPVLAGWLLVVVGGYFAVEIRAGYRDSIDQ
ncbi:hypothetical protein [Halococcoides cellulosivorans]|uniref:Uncharacterized protein n=1 Tax=Halococcoides cellulosivorans TaxID=1679096 RepID=A0A2R4X0E3_9EURY|nr:hypothetical protein [Halococcoides cellulosivorans]AWB27272.1 hypothetical protein HARCEL1_05930 [Halococcoides cellulosivorans]